MADEPGEQAPAQQQANEHVKAFFLDLAAKGKDEWNAWRRDPANKDVRRVTFAGIDFSEAPRDKIDFSEFEFGDFANFSRCKWRGFKEDSQEDSDDSEAFALGRAYFTGAIFGDSASFTCASFGDWASFAGATFGLFARFEGEHFGARTIFGRKSSFVGASFGDYARFDRADFDFGANFDYATFGDSSSFRDATFGAYASFEGAAFGGQSTLAGADFGTYTTFSGAALGDEAIFDDTVFKGPTTFTGKSGDLLSVVAVARMGEKVRATLERSHAKLWSRFGSARNCFITISFARARFEGDANFSGRTFKQFADFTQARFYYPPEFDPATKDARIDFTDAHIGFVSPGHVLHWTSDAKVPFRLRALRRIADETKNHDLERDLYIEERKAERGIYLFRPVKDLINELEKINRPEILKKSLEGISGQEKGALSKRWHKVVALLPQMPGIAVIAAITFVRLIAHLFWIAVMGVYWALADYGRSFVRPAVGLGLSVWLFHFGYAAILAPLTPQAGTLDAAKYARAEWMVALGNAVPFVGPLTIDSEIKKFLFCPGFGKCLPLPPEGFQALVIAQNVLSIILVFFIGLALRNYFRIK